MLVPLPAGNSQYSCLVTLSSSYVIIIKQGSADPLVSVPFAENGTFPLAKIVESLVKPLGCSVVVKANNAANEKETLIAIIKALNYFIDRKLEIKEENGYLICQHADQEVLRCILQ